jgi:hypothetical protein
VIDDGGVDGIGERLVGILSLSVQIMMQGQDVGNALSCRVGVVQKDLQVRNRESQCGLVGKVNRSSR